MLVTEHFHYSPVRSARQKYQLKTLRLGGDLEIERWCDQYLHQAAKEPIFTIRYHFNYLEKNRKTTKSQVVFYVSICFLNETFISIFTEILTTWTSRFVVSRGFVSNPMQDLYNLGSSLNTRRCTEIGTI